MHSSGTTESLRGVSAVSAQVAWASGTKGTYLKTTDGGASWRVAVVPGADQLDFRGVQGMDERTAYLLSSGDGDKSRIDKTYATVDCTGLCSSQIPIRRGSSDAIRFWNRRQGIVLGDPVDGQFVILTTEDAGEHWIRHEYARGPFEGRCVCGEQ